jgi:hypothetical protein
VTLTVQNLTLDGGRFRVPFPVLPGKPEDEVAAWVAEERDLYAKPEGKYTEADARANGTQPASDKFADLSPDHEEAASGDRICPVSRLKASPRVSWVVGGDTYTFCCAPCVDVFLETAKQRPIEVKSPEQYVRK